MPDRAALRAGWRTLLLVAAGCTAACSALGPADVEPPGGGRVERGAPAEAAPAAEAAPPPPPARPGAEVAAALSPAAARQRVLVIESGEAAGYRAVADAVESALAADYDVTRLTLSSAAEPAGLAGGPEPAAAVTIGVRALELAARELDVPIVFCQVFGYDLALAAAPNVYGVAPLPPLDLQLEAWKGVADGLSEVGVVVSVRHEGLVAEARAAAADAGIELHARYATSDREALYLFKRLVPSIDGLWLFPDNDVLSPAVIREMLEYGRRHDVHTLVFNASLLEWGADVNVRAPPHDVAAAVKRVLHAATNGAGGALPPVSPLTGIEIRVNEVHEPRISMAPRADPARIRRQ